MVRRSPGAWVACAAALVVRCGGSATPVLTGVSPDQGTNERAVAVVVSGRGLEPDVAVDVGCDGRAVADARFEALLGDHELSDVRWRPEGALDATVPAGLAPGIYDLRVRTPKGALLVLPAAYQVLAEEPGDGGVGDGGGDAPDGGAECETLFAISNEAVGTDSSVNPQAADGPPDGDAGSVTGALGRPDVSWTFTFPATTLIGPVHTTVTIVFWMSGATDDALVLQVSPNNGADWDDLATWGISAGAIPSVPFSESGPFDATRVNQSSKLPMTHVRLHGAGVLGSPESFTISVDYVALRVCP
jgi:hypothetical protein